MLTILITFAVGCHHGMLHQVNGSGNRQKQKREVASFTSIATEGAFEIDVDVVAEKPISLEIEGDDNVLPLITTEVSGGVLHIKTKRNYSVSSPVELRISVPTLEGISSSGAGNIEVSGIKTDKFDLDVNGAPTIKASGQTNLLEIEANGAGKIDTHRLRASRAKVETNGVSKVSVHASDQLDVTVFGPSQVTYEGDPVVNKTVHGPGSVQKKASEGS